MSTQSADVELVCKAHTVVHTKVRNRLNNKPVHQLISCYVNLRLIRKIEDEKDKRASIRVDTDGRWEDFFEAALFDSIEDEREQEGAEILFAASTGNIERDDDSDDNDSDELSF
jgi:hypothetical protein